MRPILLLIALLTPCADDPKPDKGDRDQIVGTWENVSRRFQGKDAEPFKGRWIITRDVMKSEPENAAAVYGYKLDPSSDPKRFGDRLTICVSAVENGERPQKFSVEEREGFALDVYKRIKPR
ncbi:MAG: hypothetical protein ABI353_16790 [Isosphaeraceae bacterium]